MPSGWNIYNNKEGLLQNSVIPAFAGMTYLRFLQEAQEHQDLSCVEMTSRKPKMKDIHDSS